MARSEAQKAADKRYAQKVKEKYKLFGVNLIVEEYEEIEEIIKAAEMTKADFIRWAAKELKRKTQP